MVMGQAGRPCLAWPADLAVRPHRISGLAVLGLLLLPAQIHKTFLRYEDTEDASINDRA